VCVRGRSAGPGRLHAPSGSNPAGECPRQIATYLGCCNQTVLNTLHAFQREGLGCLGAKSSTPHRVRAIWPKERDDELQELLHRSPRLFGKSRSTWTRQLLAEVCCEQGLTSREVSGEAIHRTLKRLDIN
jgi:transposase